MWQVRQKAVVPLTVDTVLAGFETRFTSHAVAPPFRTRCALWQLAQASVSRSPAGTGTMDVTDQARRTGVLEACTSVAIDAVSRSFGYAVALTGERSIGGVAVASTPGRDTHALPFQPCTDMTSDVREGTALVQSRVPHVDAPAAGQTSAESVPAAG